MPSAPIEQVGQGCSADAPLVLAPLQSIPVDRGLRVCAGGLDLALFRVGDGVHAMDDSCPHRGGSLSAGRLQDGVITCPAHGLRFDVRTACGVAQPPLQGRSYPVRVQDGAVVMDRPLRSAPDVC